MLSDKASWHSHHQPSQHRLPGSTAQYQVGFDLVQLPAVVPNGIVQAPVAVDVLLHGGQVHAPGHHVHLRLQKKRDCPSSAGDSFLAAAGAKGPGNRYSSASAKTKDVELLGRLRQEDQFSLGVQSQPGPHNETPRRKKRKAVHKANTY